MQLAKALCSIALSGVLVISTGVAAQAAKKDMSEADLEKTLTLIQKVTPHDSRGDYLRNQTPQRLSTSLSEKRSSISSITESASSARSFSSERSSQGRTTINSDPDVPLVYEPEGTDNAVGINLPSDLDLNDGVKLDSAVAFQDAKSGVVVTAESVEGGARIHTVLEDAASPHSFSYALDLPSGTSHHQYDDGSIVFTDANGEVVSMVAPAWAKDATGKSVPTQISFEDGALTQIVSPKKVKSVTYPIVADPYMGRALFGSFNTSKRWNSQVVYSGTKTKWGQDIHNGSAGDEAGWVGGVIVGQGIMRNEGWAEWKKRFGSTTMTNKATLYQQYSCHVLGGFYNWAGDWNLERARSNNSGWGWNAAFHRCNW